MTERGTRERHWLCRMVRCLAAILLFAPVLMLSAYLLFAEIWDNTEDYNPDKPITWWLGLLFT